jgi:hypothetical protein
MDRRVVTIRIEIRERIDIVREVVVAGSSRTPRSGAV